MSTRAHVVVPVTIGMRSMCVISPQILSDGYPKGMSALAGCGYADDAIRTGLSIAIDRRQKKLGVENEQRIIDYDKVLSFLVNTDSEFIYVWDVANDEFNVFTVDRDAKSLKYLDKLTSLLEDEDKASDDEQQTVTEESIKAKIRGATWTFLPSHKSCVCEITMKNGFTVRGESAIVDERYFDPDVAKKISYEDAFRKIWALEGYLLQEMLYLAAEKQSKNGFSDMSEL